MSCERFVLRALCSLGFRVYGNGGLIRECKIRALVPVAKRLG